jgi:hypothetical protein
MTIIASKNGKDAKAIGAVSFDLEKYLQQYLFDNSVIVPICDMDGVAENAKLFVAAGADAGEFITPSGERIDALGFDESGNIYVIETKLFRNDDKRKVIAQVLDYGASLWKNTTDDDFFATLDVHTRRKFQKNFTDQCSEFFHIEIEQVEFLKQNIRDNLKGGKIKFVVLMDKLEQRLKDLIVYLNENSEFSIYAVEVEYYKLDEYEVVIPKLFGGEVRKPMSSNRGNIQWTEESFLAALSEQERGEEKIALVKRILEWVKPFCRLESGKGGKCGSIIPVVDNKGEKCFSFVFYTYGKIELQFQYYQIPFNDEPKKLELLNRLNKIKGVSIPDEKITKRPSISMDLLFEESEYQKFIDAYQWYFDEIKNYQG